ncbi:MAG: hypothetical protein ABIR57_12190 [Aeromicrobium sp.]
MTVSLFPSSVATLRELQDRVNQMQGRPATQPLATHPAFAGLLALQTGASYGVDSASLAMALMAGPSGDGAWCGVVGSAEFGIEAAAAAGVELSRTILVPDPGDQWLDVTSALIDVLTVVVVKPPGRVSEGAVSRISARLRQRGAMLIAWGDWPRCDARLSMGDAEWVGLGKGHGHLRARQATVSVRKGTAPAEQRRLWLPDADRIIRRVESVPNAVPRIIQRVS